MVSGTFHSPKRGTFHFSLTLLITIGRRVVLSLTGWSPRIHTGFHVSGATWDPFGSPASFAYEAVTLCGGPFQNLRLDEGFVTPWWSCGPTRRSHYPDGATATTLARRRFGLFPFRSPLLRESIFLYFPEGTKMFQFPSFPAPGYGFTRNCTGITPCALPHLRDPRIKACLTASRGLSQLCHVFLRLSTPKHPPCTLSCLNVSALERSIHDSCLVFNERTLPTPGLVPPAPFKEWWRRRGSNP